jgi:hypothetical protein
MSNREAHLQIKIFAKEIIPFSRVAASHPVRCSCTSVLTGSRLVQYNSMLQTFSHLIIICLNTVCLFVCLLCHPLGPVPLPLVAVGVLPSSTAAGG